MKVRKGLGDHLVHTVSTFGTIWHQLIEGYDYQYHDDLCLLYSYFLSRRDAMVASRDPISPDEMVAGA